MQNRTKIVATLASNRSEAEFIQELIQAGVDVIRINSAHCTPEEASAMVERLRKQNHQIPVMIDTKGPEVRVCPFLQPMEVEMGMEVRFYAGINFPSGPGNLAVTYPGFVTEMEPGLQILVDDGDLAFQVLRKEPDCLVTKALNTGRLLPRKSVNVPGKSFSLPAVSERDREFIRWAMEAGIEFIAHSFVRRRADLEEIQKILDERNSKIKLIAKIENQEGVDRIDEILDLAYGVMIARGDLGIEIEAEKIPMIQRKLIRKCIEKQKPVIIATQMLHSMIRNPRPTRAEVTDIAHGVMEGADALMLSGETAAGDFPLEAVTIMNRIIGEVEQEIGERLVKPPKIKEPVVGEILGRSAVWSAYLLKARAIVCDTATGRTVRHLSAQRGQTPIFAMCYNDEIMRELMLLYGVFPLRIPLKKSTDHFILTSMKLLLSGGGFSEKDQIVVLGGNFGPAGGATFIEIGSIAHLLHREK